MLCRNARDNSDCVSAARGETPVPHRATDWKPVPHGPLQFTLIPNPCFLFPDPYPLTPFFSIFAHVSLSVTVRLKMRRSGVESGSTLK